MQDEITTIAALATAPAPAGIAVVRVSGPRTRTALNAIFRSKQDPALDPRRLTFGNLVDYRSGEMIDQALAVFMPGPHSYTGEDICEFQFHGSPGLVQKVLRSLFAFGVHPAEPGEFTKRAFLNGKVDLVQAEAICDMIHASSDQALRVASEQLHGRLSSAVNDIGEPLRDLLAEIEATIDFPEEGISPARSDQLKAGIGNALAKVTALVSSYQYGHLVRDGFKVLLCGRPNVGKSSILNLLLGRERAIVTEISGTTRDLLEEEAVFSGYRFIFCDSAGLIETDNKVERIGIELARKRVLWADVVLFVVDATDHQGAWKETLETLKDQGKKIWMITNKIDLNPNAFGEFFCDSRICAQNFYLSAKTKAGVEPLIKSLVEEVASTVADSGQSSSIVTNERHRQCLETAQKSLASAFHALESSLPSEITSGEIRIALKALEEIVGKTYTEDILGRIFSKFCIGK